MSASNSLTRTEQMFEHMKNYEALFKKVSTWLKPRPTKQETSAPKDTLPDESLLFIHIFCHRTSPYHFVEDDGWMAKNFFSGWFASQLGRDDLLRFFSPVAGGTMPSHDLFVRPVHSYKAPNVWHLTADRKKKN
jgi:hypothetical protein